MSDLSNSNLSALIPYVAKNDVVIVGVLNWGLGHATRCIPMIDWLATTCRKVIIASDGEALQILNDQFPHLPTYHLPSYGMYYKYEDVGINIIASSPNILRAINIENKLANRVAQDTGATLIISDNRLGFRSKLTKNIYLTHQVNILHRYTYLGKLGTWMHRYFIKKFDHCLIPDYKGGQALAPALSDTESSFYSYTGPMTRIRKLNLPLQFDILVILSGPEPQRTHFELMLWQSLTTMKTFKICIVGTKTLSLIHEFPHITVKPLVNTSEIEALLNSSKVLISRSGYTTIMDVFGLDIKAIFVPTPGQTEQEYLANLHSNGSKYIFLKQNELNKLPKTINYLI